MRDRDLVKEFGGRLRNTLSGAGFRNLSDVCRRLGLGMGFVSQLRNGYVRDAGVFKLADLAVLSGKLPSRLIAEVDDLLLNPPVLTEAEAAAYGIAGYPEAFDRLRLAIVVDVVERHLPDDEVPEDLQLLGPVIVELYDEIVRGRPPGDPLVVRQRSMAAVLGVKLPDDERAQPRHAKR